MILYLALSPPASAPFLTVQGPLNSDKKISTHRAELVSCHEPLRRASNQPFESDSLPSLACVVPLQAVISKMPTRAPIPSFFPCRWTPLCRARFCCRPSFFATFESRSNFLRHHHVRPKPLAGFPSLAKIPAPPLRDRACRINPAPFLPWPVPCRPRATVKNSRGRTAPVARPSFLLCPATDLAHSRPVCCPAVRPAVHVARCCRLQVAIAVLPASSGPSFLLCPATPPFSQLLARFSKLTMTSLRACRMPSLLLPAAQPVSSEASVSPSGSKRRARP